MRARILAAYVIAASVIAVPAHAADGAAPPKGPPLPTQFTTGQKSPPIAKQSAITPAPPRAQTAADRYFGDDNPKLTPRERAALAVNKGWVGSSVLQTDLAAPGPDGIVRFVYGTQQVSIVCAVLQVCDVELQLGETVNTMHLGDSTRWVIEPAVTGAPPNEVQHLIIKPTDVGLETSVVVATTRRTYHLRLRSHRTQFMARVGFSYPEDASAKWAAVKAREQTQERTRQRNTLPDTKEYLGDLSFDYTVTGTATWKPVRVYNNGIKTIIQMPSAMVNGEAPTLLVLRKEGGVFTDEELVQVNYSLQGDRYVVDTIFDRAILIAGVGSAQERVTIGRAAAREASK